MARRTVIEWLDLWGEWERVGSGAWLGYTSPCQDMIERNVEQLSCARPCLNDDDAMWLNKILARLKIADEQLYQILVLVHVREASMRDVSLTLNCNRHCASQTYERAVGWVEGAINFLESAA